MNDRQEQDEIREELQFTLQSAKLGTWKCNTDLSDMKWSPEIFRILGLEAETIPTQERLFGAIHPDDLDEFSRLVRDAALEGREWRLEHRILQPGSQIRTLVSTIQPWKTAGKIIGTMLDVTEARVEARRVEESETIFRTCMNALQAGVVYMDQSGKVRQVNPKAAQLLGLSEDQELGLAPIDLDWRAVDEDGMPLPVSDQPLGRAYSRNESVEDCVIGLLRPEGHVTWVSVNATPINGSEGGSPIGAVASLTDITELRHQQELHLKEMVHTSELAITLEMQKIELEMMNERLEALATTDALTGLKNRRVFMEFLEKELAITKRSGVPISVLIIDVDKFKSFNDDFGHQVGDEVLQGVAKALASAVRDSDFIARYGGEEFVIALPTTSRGGAILAAERYRKVIESSEWPYRQVTASFGAATSADGQISVGDLIAAADGALYQSKRNGRNCTTHAEEIDRAA